MPDDNKDDDFIDTPLVDGDDDDLASLSDIEVLDEPVIEEIEDEEEGEEEDDSQEAGAREEEGCEEIAYGAPP